MHRYLLALLIVPVGCASPNLSPLTVRSRIGDVRSGTKVARPAPLYAPVEGDEPDPTGAVQEAYEAEGEGEAAEEIESRNMIALFLGGTHEFESKEDGPSVGLDYEYRLDARFGVGATLEYIGGDIDKSLIIAGGFLHPIGELRFGLLGGLELSRGEGEGLVRFVVDYDIAIGGLSIIPTLAVDFSTEGEQSLLYVLAFGYGF